MPYTSTNSGAPVKAAPVRPEAPWLRDQLPRHTGGEMVLESRHDAVDAFDRLPRLDPYEQIEPSVIDYRDVWYIDSEGQGFSALSRMLTTPVAGVVAGHDGEGVLRYISAMPGWGRKILVCDIDAFLNLSVAVDNLIAFRAEHPGTPVVIGSHDFRVSDLTRDRSMVADASVPLPVGRATFALALAAAVANAGRGGEDA